MQINYQLGKFMLRIATYFVAALFVMGTLEVASAQTPAPAPAKTSRFKLTAEKLREMKAKWHQNYGKLKACRKEVKRQGLVGDDRWFYISDCMDKT
jgi:hypothetical protein